MAAKEKPASVTVIGWIYIVLAVFGIFGGTGGIIITRAMSGQLAELRNDPVHGDLHRKSEEMRSEMLGPANLIFKNIQVLPWIQLILSFPVLIAAIYFLKRREWARRILEGVQWLGLLWIGTFGAFWVYMANRMTSHFSSIPESQVDANVGNFFPSFIAAGIAIMLLSALVPILFICLLRGKKIRAAMR